MICGKENHTDVANFQWEATIVQGNKPFGNQKSESWINTKTSYTTGKQKLLRKMEPQKSLIILC